ncbi:MAG: zinc-dependent alcohol dehydrogenase family protein [Ignavibacteria bacterium]|nr:zinc-dependent alcohol dehydrogenase family protein [Ignavibacteria bacterium]
MKAVLFDKPHSLNVVSRDLRTLRNGEILVKVETCGICGTDLHIVEGTSRSTPPVILGHEYAGIVADAGNVRNLVPGQKIAVDPNISCGVCYYCRRGLINLCENLLALGVDIDGGMAEHCIIPWKQAYAIPDEMSLRQSAFIEPLSCAVHGIDIAQVKHGDTVVIVGAGPIGLLMLQLAIHAGAARVIVVEPDKGKRDLAHALGATAALDPGDGDVESAVRDLTGVGADVVIECAGKTETCALAIRLARRGGRVELFGVCPTGRTIPVEPHQVYFRELSIVGSYVNPHTFDRAISLLHSGVVTVDTFPVHLFPLEGIHDALRIQREGQSVKSILQPQL